MEKEQYLQFLEGFLIDIKQNLVNLTRYLANKLSLEETRKEINQYEQLKKEIVKELRTLLSSSKMTDIEKKEIESQILKPLEESSYTTNPNVIQGLLTIVKSKLNVTNDNKNPKFKKAS